MTIEEKWEASLAHIAARVVREKKSMVAWQDGDYCYAAPAGVGVPPHGARNAVLMAPIDGPPTRHDADEEQWKDTFFQAVVEAVRATGARPSL